MHKTNQNAYTWCTRRISETSAHSALERFLHMHTICIHAQCLALVGIWDGIHRNTTLQKVFTYDLRMNYPNGNLALEPPDQRRKISCILCWIFRITYSIMPLSFEAVRNSWTSKAAEWEECECVLASPFTTLYHNREYAMFLFWQNIKRSLVLCESVSWLGDILYNYFERISNTLPNSS